MKYRCPYCKTILGEQRIPKCLQCGRVMLFPDDTSKKKSELTEKQKKGADFLQPGGLRTPDPNFLLRPAVVLPAMALLIAIGAMLAWQVHLKLPDPQNLPAENIASAQKNLRTLRIALERFKIDCGRYPTTEEGLKALVLNPGTHGWRHNYINILRSDPWRTPYYYECTNDTVFLCSFGPDKIKDTADDIVAPTPTSEEVDWPPPQSTGTVEKANNEK